MSFTKSLRHILEDRKMTVAQLARESGVPAKTIYHWLSGQQPRKMEHLFRICDLLNITVEELYGRPRKLFSDLQRKPTTDSLPGSDLHSDLQAGMYELILRPARKKLPT